VDQVIHDIILMKIPVVVGIDRAGLIGGDGSTHQGIYDISLLRPLPGIVLMAPKDENELQHMVYTGFKLKKPVFIRFPKEPGIGVELDREFKELPFGKGEVLREGKDGIVLAVGTLVYRALAAAEELFVKEKIDLSVINARFIKPLDRELIISLLEKSKVIVTIEDGIRNGGFSSKVRELLITERVENYKVLSLGVPEEIIEVASREELLEKYSLNAAGIYKEIKKFLD
jgi:1-deoxy-D-xylulose-5-phosphate synthase